MERVDLVMKMQDILKAKKHLTRYVEFAAHGNCLCEIRSGEAQYSIVPGSLHSKTRKSRSN